MDVEGFFRETRDRIDDHLKQLVSSLPDLPYSALFTSARYSLLSSKGKRLRPLLAMATAASFGIGPETAVAPACALEMVHAYSLIHDDLPCMDDDDLRRGQPTLHKMVPEWQALLTGNYLLTHAFEVLSNAPGLSLEQKVALVHSLATHAGAHGMLGGQMIDLLCVGKTVDWEMLEQMHVRKTGGLIVASLEFGGIIANAPEEDLHLLKRTGLAIGTAFQLIDDLLNDTGSEQELGKPVGSDREKSKATAVSLLGIARTKEKALMLLEAAGETLNALSTPTPLVRALLERMVHRTK